MMLNPATTVYSLGHIDFKQHKSKVRLQSDATINEPNKTNNKNPN